MWWTNCWGAERSLQLRIQIGKIYAWMRMYTTASSDDSSFSKFVWIDKDRESLLWICGLATCVCTRLQTTQQKKWHKWEIWFMSPLAHISCSTDEVHKVRFHIEGTERRTWETPRPLRGAFKLDFLYLLIFGTFYTRQYLYLYKDFFVLNWRVGVKKIKWVDGNVSLCVFV